MSETDSDRRLDLLTSHYTEREGKIGRYFLNNTSEMHVGGIPSNLPEKHNRRFNLQLSETSEGKLSILKLLGLN
jgi:hypothetical protein